jgi:SAM-dependent methyltransferase
MMCPHRSNVQIEDDAIAQKTEARLLKFGRANGLWRRGIAYAHYCRHQLFAAVPLRHVDMLDVGCGAGVFMAWASVHGAHNVVGLEPSGAGSGPASPVAVFDKMRSELGLFNVTLCKQVFQDFHTKDTFDLILLHHSINHLDEESCIRLRDCEVSRARYLTVFRKMRALLRPNGRLLIVDCSNRSFWSDVGLRNPLAPDIEWFKHQPPSVWIRLLEESGFRHAHVSWIYDNRLLNFGRLFANPVAAYFTASLFRIELRASA